MVTFAGIGAGAGAASGTEQLDASQKDVETHQEIEKMDKESRIARRAFEQRIQKHKIIQEKCEDDLQRLQSEQDAKAQELARKEDNALAKRDAERVRVQEEFERKLAEVSGWGGVSDVSGWVWVEVSGWM
jgi:hypothetical protein